MAKRRGRSRRNFVTIPFTGGLSLGTLGDEAVVKGAPIAAFGEDFYLISVDLQISGRGQTDTESPLQVGFAHGDLTATEIEECLQAEVTDPDDIIAKERSRRPVRTAGMLRVSDTESVLDGGRTQRIRGGFVIGNDHSFSTWCANRSGSTLTTGAVIEFSGNLYGRWLR